MTQPTNKARIVVLEDKVEGSEDAIVSHDKLLRGHNGSLGMDGRLILVEKQLNTILSGLKLVLVAIGLEFLGRIFGVI